MIETYDVVIAGCGPTGLVAGLLLAKSGRTVVLLDRHETIYPLPRAIAFDHEIARILGLLGLDEAMAPLVDVPGIYQWRNGAGELLFELNWGEAQSISGYAASYLFSQPDMERVLNQAAQANPLITMRRGVEMTGFTQCEQGVTVIGTLASGQQLQVRGRWLIGADGANSTVRQALGIELEDLGFRADWLVVDVMPKPGTRLPMDDNLMLQVCDPARPTTVVSGGPGRRRWEFMALAGETLADLNCEEKAWDLLAPWNITPEKAVLERHAVYTFRGALAQSWRNGRVFLAGDAAHLTPPFAGQGLCAGLRDAAALAWRLSLALDGRGGDHLLDTYESERKAHARAWIMNAIELGKVICVLDPAAAAMRDQGLKAALASHAPPPSSAVLPALGPGVFLPAQGGGTLAPGGRIRVSEKAGHCDTFTGPGFVLLTRSQAAVDALQPETRRFFERLDGTIVVVDEAADIDGVFAQWFETTGAETALVRPDFYLVGVGSGAAATESLVALLQTYITAAAETAA